MFKKVFIALLAVVISSVLVIPTVAGAQDSGDAVGAAQVAPPGSGAQ